MNIEFNNEQVSFIKVPTLETIIFKPLNRKYCKVVLCQSIIVLVLLVIIASLFYLIEIDGMENSIKLMISITIVFLGILFCALQWLGVNKKGYAVRTHDIIYKTGLINRKEIIIPFNRVQHIETYEGAILRLFGLCQLEFFTAGGALGDLKIPGLLKIEAEQIKTYVVSKVKPLEEQKSTVTNITEIATDNLINE